MNRKILPLAVVVFILLSVSQSFADGEDTARADSFHISEEVTHYPSEENTTELEITVNTNERARISNFNIRNIGDNDAINVSWNLNFQGGLILIGRSYCEVEASPIRPDDDIIVVYINAGRHPIDSLHVLGIGKPIMTITAEADNAAKVEQTVETFLFINLLFKI